MKGMKKIAAFACAAMLSALFALPAWAAGETYSITINNQASGHTYEAYQIFSGDLHEGVLSNIEWGDGVTAAGQAKYESAAKAAEGLTSVALAEQFAIDIEQYLADPAGTDNTVSGGVYVIDNLPAGYYLIKDKDGSLQGANDSYTTFILKVVGNTEATPKNTVSPSIDKEVYDEPADSEQGAEDGWGSSADHAIGESFQFRLVGTLPADPDYAAYDAYKVVFADTMSAGITFESIASVTVDGKSVTDYTTTAQAGQAGGSWTITIADVLAYDADLSDGCTIIVVYNAHLNASAASGADKPNTNEARMSYSNNPNVSGEGEDLGVTAGDSVWVFTYGVDNTKEDGEERPLAGAGFKLYADENCATEIGLVFDAALDCYRPVLAGEQAEEMISAQETGKFNIYGLDTGKYYLKETTTPAGYNSCEVIEIELTAAHANGESTLVLKINNEVAESNTVVNLQGATLPSTGGIGTTLFYVVGAVLVVGACVLLVARRRSNSGE